MLKWFRKQSAPAPSPGAPAEGARQADPDELMRQAFPLHQAGNVAVAEQLYRQILALSPDYADAHFLLGKIAQESGRPEEAMPHLRNALRCNGREPSFHKTLGEIHAGLGHWQEAAVYFRNAVDLAPADLEAWNNLGCAYEQLGQDEDAAACFEKTRHVARSSPAALNQIGMNLRQLGRADEAIDALRQAQALAPDDAAILSNYLYALNFSEQVSHERRFEEHLAFDRRFGTGRFGGPARRAGGAEPSRRLRIAYFSADLRSHPVACFLEPALRAHDRDAFQVWCYFLHPYGDAVTARLQSLVDHWVECRGLDDAALADRIARDGIDILVDLGGHTGGNRLPVLGRKPAPVIATWLGYPNTTGLRTVDYRLTDALSEPPGMTERFCTETLVRLPRQWCYSDPGIDAEVSPLPASARGYVQFGSFNNGAKLTAPMLRLWADIVRRVPGSRLLVWGVGAEQGEYIRALFSEAGVDPARLELSDRTSFPKQAELYQRVDIALDTYPYGGVTTTFNSLWMGVPVVTLAGDTCAARSTHAILCPLGLPDWSADSPAGYADVAVAKAGDLAALSALRARLRPLLQGSPFMDAPGFTRALESAYREMWRERGESGAAPSVAGPEPPS